MLHHEKTVFIIRIFPAIIIFAITSQLLAIKCGTIDGINYFYAGEVIATPVLPYSFGTEHFKIWYDTTGYNSVFPGDIDDDNIPDYVESTAVYLEHVWGILMDSLKYREPIPDSTGFTDPDSFGGDERVDVYLAKLSDGMYGMTYPRKIFTVGRSQKASAYITINCDLTSIERYKDNPFPALRVTCAHEFFHVVQFAYRFPSDAINFGWWLEATAVFDEEFVYDDVNDYYQYIPGFQDNPRLPLFYYPSSEPSAVYGAVLFPIFLEELLSPPGVRFTGEIVKRSWEYCETETPAYAVRDIAEEHGKTFADIIQLFQLWRVRVGSNWHEGYFYEGRNYPPPKTDTLYFGDSLITIDDSLQSLSMSYYTLAYAPFEYGVVANLRLIDFSSGWLMLLPVELPGDTPNDALFAAPGHNVAVAGRWQYKEIIISPTILSTATNGALKITVRRTDSLSVPMSWTAKIGKPFPNPCRGDNITFRVELTRPTKVSLKIFDSSGEFVWEHNEHITIPGKIEIFWSCENHLGQKVAPGVYIYTISAGEQKGSGKILIIK